MSIAMANGHKLSIAHDSTQLNIEWNDGHNSEFLAVWLRDHCQMPESRDAHSGQRLMNVTDFPLDVSIESITPLDNQHVEIIFSPLHRSVFSLDWLEQNAYDKHLANDIYSEQNKVLWDSSFSTEKSVFDYDAYLSNKDTSRALFDHFALYGFAILENVPCKEGQILDVIDTFGYVRDTNYGKLFEVKTQVEPNNLAFTNLGLGLHADNPYRDPVPTVQLLHCLENTVEGGESILGDGFKAASILREESQADFDLLSQTWINFRFQDKDTDLQSRVPLIEVNDKGQVVKVRFNNRSIAPINIDKQKMKAFYKAYQHYAEILNRTSIMIDFKLTQGQLVMFDNTRVFHARKAFSTSGSRWLQGAYADVDSLYSLQSVLSRKTETDARVTSNPSAKKTSN
ncbi:2-trimethylaminoethylphosphonate dioxygenase [Marinomonas sp. PE14-40]|uniref:2-trimethylaminoethylphosphonate dioxygenase n=1 Tax=Marinomonas sp. PE14-40 TaxID=3060621 RepID=UPI003F6762BA